MQFARLRARTRSAPLNRPSSPQTAWWWRRKPRAARIGVDILKRGGNAVDAAVAVGFALAVTYPRAGNLGGGGFMVIHRANGQDIAIDYRETAPRGDHGQHRSSMRRATPTRRSRAIRRLRIGVPGTVAGLALAEEKYGSGRFTLADLIAPAIALARDGIAVTAQTRAAAAARAVAARALAVLGEDISQAGRQRLLRSATGWCRAILPIRCEAIARGGPRAFYEGPIAQKIADAVQAAGGVMTADDLKDYRAVERTPVRGTYRGYDIVSMPPPSSGGVELDRDAQHSRRLRSRP